MSIAAVCIRVNLCLFHSLRYSLVHSLVEFDSSVLFYATAFGLDSLESLTLSFPFCAFRACFLSYLPVLRACAPPWVCPRVSTCEDLFLIICVPLQPVVCRVCSLAVYLQ